jgi:hypothetical protein
MRKNIYILNKTVITDFFRITVGVIFRIDFQLQFNPKAIAQTIYQGDFKSVSPLDLIIERSVDQESCVRLFLVTKVEVVYF